MKKCYKTELHAHTKPVSRCSDIEPEFMVKTYKEKGYDSIAITNHFTTDLKGETIEEKVKWYLGDYYKCAELGKSMGLNVILGAELRFAENNNDYLVFGICPEDLAEIYKMLPYGIDRFYKEYKNERNIIIQAHPFRDGIEKVKPESLDGIEVFNMHPEHNSRIGIAAVYASENNLIGICGSDFHHFGQDCLCGILTEKPIENSYDVSEVLKNREYSMVIGNYVVGI